MREQDRLSEQQVSGYWKENRVLIICIVALIALIAIGGNAFAGTAAITWEQPTLGTDGKPVGKITGNSVYQSTDGAALVRIKALAAPATSYTLTGLGFGVFCFAVTASNSLGESGKSAQVCKTIVDPAATTTPPAAPVLKTVTITAYTIGTVDGRPAMVAAGTVPIGTQCEQSIAIATLHLIPKAAVTPSLPSAWYFAKCAAS
jgi:hypothetical protein